MDIYFHPRLYIIGLCLHSHICVNATGFGVLCCPMCGAGLDITTRQDSN